MKIGDVVRILPVPISNDNSTNYIEAMRDTIGKHGLITDILDDDLEINYQVHFRPPFDLQYDDLKRFWYYDKEYLVLEEDKELLSLYLEWTLER